MIRRFLWLFPVLMILAGCVGTSYHKSVTVHKDGDGRVTQIIVVEEISQPNRTEKPWPFKYLEE